MSQLVPKEQAREILMPHASALAMIMNESLVELNLAMNATNERWNNRAKCSTLHSLAIEKAKRHFVEQGGVLLKMKYQSLQIVFNNSLVGRIKKVNHNNLSSNAKTYRNTDILTHQLVLFSDETSLTFIDLGYKVDATWTYYERLVIVCRTNDSIEWTINIDNNNDATGTITTLPLEPIVPLVREEKQIKIKKAE
ncbi:MAG: hypothetical protein IPP77_03690 [Bacteroidetes bacterium]|nr:hypothetical protein [Bacteroidota bacterium]